MWRFTAARQCSTYEANGLSLLPVGRNWSSRHAFTRLSLRSAHTSARRHQDSLHVPVVGSVPHILNAPRYSATIFDSICICIGSAASAFARICQPTGFFSTSTAMLLQHFHSHNTGIHPRGVRGQRNLMVNEQATVKVGGTQRSLVSLRPFVASRERPNGGIRSTVPSDENLCVGKVFIFALISTIEEPPRSVLSCCQRGLDSALALLRADGGASQV